MSDVLDALQAAAADALDKSGLSVAVKTNLGPEVTVYKAGDASAPSPLATLLQVGIQVRDSNDKVLYTWGGWPDTNLYAVAAIAGLAGLLLYLIARGLR